jgi:hypothetical protein
MWFHLAALSIPRKACVGLLGTYKTASSRSDLRVDVGNRNNAMESRNGVEGARRQKP